MRRLLFLICVGAIATATAVGQTAPQGDQTQEIKDLRERMERLEKRLEELEAIQGSQLAVAHADPKITTPTKSDPAPEVSKGQEQRPESHSEHAQFPRVEANYPSLQFRGFTDIDFAATDQKGVPSSSGFRLGQFVLHLTSPLSKKISFFGEISFTARPDGFALEVERSVIRYDYDDYFKLSFGRYHTPINYWNTAYHHGLWLQTTIDRPEMIQFGGRLLPVHFVGFLAEGSIPSGGIGLNYNVGVGNGRGAIISRAGDAGDINNNRAWVVNIFARPASLYGFQVGGSLYGDKVSPAVAPTNAIGPNARELITSAHIVWTKEHPEFLAEFANVRHRDIATDQVFNSQAFYIQVAYRLPWLDKRWKPYYRFEHIHVPASEPIFHLAGNTVLNLVGSTVGLRYDISEYAAFKGEYRNVRRLAGEPRINGLFIQTSFTF
ncbi:MAG TPA: hypothetical protein VHM88_22035 [Candidatus Acidoferrales bacterium]|jgi:gas vesicle protein|nr:hypothetical protein [Candidatus Acidoferrales bacterium]